MPVISYPYIQLRRQDASQLSAFLLNDQGRSPQFAFVVSELLMSHSTVFAAVPKIETRVPDEEAAILSKAGIKYTQYAVSDACTTCEH